jgi:hypothetical protein
MDTGCMDAMVMDDWQGLISNFNAGIYELLSVFPLETFA